MIEKREKVERRERESNIWQESEGEVVGVGPTHKNLKRK